MPSEPPPSGGAPLVDHRAEANRLIAYHAEISKVMTTERTSLESRLIPVSAYVVIACLEAYYRYPDMVRAIDAAMPAEQIGGSTRRPGVQVNPVYLWSIANFYLVGRKVLTTFDMDLNPVDDHFAVLDFWERAARAWREDGHAQAWDAGFVVRPYGDDVLAPLLASVEEIGDESQRAHVRRFNATLVAYLFLQYFDTRVGTGDTGPYLLPDGKVLLVRDFYRLAESDFPWSAAARDVPYRNLTAALVLDGVDLKVNDWGTSITRPEDYVAKLVGYGLCTTDTPDGDAPDGSLRPVPLDELDSIMAAVRTAQSTLYRDIAAMTRRQKIDAGAYVYFSFLRPFAQVAGVADDLDWSVPKATAGALYEAIEPMEGTNEPPDPDEVYYLPIP